jgi:hypothetical protein
MAARYTHAKQLNPAQSQQFERRSNDRVDRVPVFKVKEVDPLSKNLGFVIRLDS